ncbi:STN domain-containing protein [Ectopseudomonas chengduensis]
MALTAVWTAPSIVHGASDKLESLLDFAIPAQELTSALDQYSRASGMGILIDRELAQGRRSAPVQGRLGAREALEHLLAGSGLMALYTGAETFTVKPAQVSNGGGKRTRSRQLSDGDSFARALQAALQQALCGDALTRPGHYRAALQLWVGALGDVQHSRLLASTGDLQRDAAVVVRLRGLRVGQLPPSSLPQPITVLVVPGSAVSSVECNPS